MMDTKTQIGFYFDQSRCIGCFTCVAACRSWNELPPEAPDLMRLLSWEEGAFPNVSLRHLLLTCFHCAEPACVDACPEGIIEKSEENGRVFITDADACTSCHLCLDTCPYDAPRFGAEANAGVQKCDLCFDRLAEGNKPACVVSCPVEALDVGPLKELKSEHGETTSVPGFPDPAATRPSIIFKAKERESSAKVKQ